MSQSTSPLKTPTIDSSKLAIRYRELSPRWRTVMAVLTAVSILLAVNQVFNLGFFVGYVLLDSRYMYLITGVMLSMVFVTFPATKHSPRHVPWYDILIMLLIAGVFAYFAFYAERIVLEAWEYAAPPVGVWLALLTWAIVMEAGRRAGGWPVFTIVALFSLYPTFADKLPNVIAALSIPVQDVAMFHVMGAESLFGIPMQVFAQLVFGFLVFGVSLQYTGGGPFFINLAFALLGHKRGGPAKVSIFSSGLMGSMSGGPISNVLTTGPLSIPAMQRIGFSREYAAGVEACASTGGVLMPPIMGATAFVMASFLNISYVTVAIAAIVPSLLYFFGLFMQIDAHAARDNLQGLPKEELPRVGEVFRDGWYFIAVFAALIWMLVFMQREAVAPFYATALLLVINQFTKHKLDKTRLLELVATMGKLLAELAGILAAIGLIIGGLAVTGIAGTIANDLVYLAGENVLVLLMMGALTSFVLGIGIDGYRSLYLPRNRIGSRADELRVRSPRESYVCYVLGHAELYYAAGCLGRLRRSLGRAGLADAGRSAGYASGCNYLFRAVLFRVESGSSAAGQLVGKRAGALHCTAGRCACQRGVAGLSNWCW